MRDLKECKAEVLRRSEERIKERRRTRKRVLAWGIPLCLCIAVCSVTVSPGVMPEGNNIAAEYETKAIGSASNESTVHAYVMVEIQGKGAFTGYYQKITDAPGITEIFSEVNHLRDAGNPVPEEESDFETGKDAQDDTDSTQTEFLITFTSAEGLKSVYALKGNQLLNESNNGVICLSDAQLAELKEVLGLTH